MLQIHQIPMPVVSVAPAEEPLSVAEAKIQLNIASSNTDHDTELAIRIESARQQWEQDVGEYYIKRTMTLTMGGVDEMQFPHRPVTSISSIQYYDTGNSSQTLASSVYQLDTARSQLRLAYLQDWPSVADRWDAVTITYILGSHDDSTTVPGYAKSAMLLLIANEFEQRDMMTPDFTQNQVAYERLVAKHHRSSYP